MAWFSKWRNGRRERRELKALAHIQGFLRSEDEDLRSLNALCTQMKTAIQNHDFGGLTTLYARFEQRLKDLKQRSSIVKKLDKGILRKSIFNQLRKGFA